MRPGRRRSIWIKVWLLNTLQKPQALLSTRLSFLVTKNWERPHIGDKILPPHSSPTKLLTFQGPAGGTSTLCALHSSEDSCATSTAPSTRSLIAISIPRAQPITESAAMFAQAALRCVFYDRSKQQTVRHKKLCAPGVGACIVPHRHAQGIKAAS